MADLPFDATGHAALAICESLLISLTESKVLDHAEAEAVLADAAAAHRGAVSVADRAHIHEAAADIIDVIIRRGNSIRAV